MDTWQEDTNAWEEESDAAWEAEEVLRWYVRNVPSAWHAEFLNV